MSTDAEYPRVKVLPAKGTTTTTSVRVIETTVSGGLKGEPGTPATNFFHIGDSPPADTSKIWIDTS